MGAFGLQRRQLPIRVASALTINKAQGLTLRRSASTSRRTSSQTDADGAVWTKNVVYTEVVIDDL